MESTQHVLSMTGFGAGEVAIDTGTLRLELRAVNHRHLDVRVRVPSELNELSGLIEELVRARCTRGRIEAQGMWRGVALSGAELDIDRARQAYHVLLRVRDELAPTEAVPLAALFTVPGLFAPRQWPRDEIEAALRLACERAISELTAMRTREGQALALDMATRLARLRNEGQVIASLRPTVIESAQRRLVKRIEKLLEGGPFAIDSARLAQEVAWFADKSDVAEELTRLSSHLDEFERTLEGHGESIGRKLEFVVQEIGRELNTLGAKANDAEISRRVVEMKAELERIREQVQNIL